MSTKIPQPTAAVCLWPNHPVPRTAVVLKEWVGHWAKGVQVPLCDLCSKAADVDDTFDVATWVLALGNSNLTEVYRHLAQIDRGSVSTQNIHNAVKAARLTGSGEGENVARWIERRGVDTRLYTILGVST